MDMQQLTVSLLLLAVIAGNARTLWFALHRASRPPAWRIALLLVLQVASGALLYRTLFPPAMVTGTDTLVVATGKAPSTLADSLSAQERLVALPEAPAIPMAERVPDLATALRRYPATARLRIVGRGLTARDRESVRGLSFTFVPASLPRGLVELPASVRVQSGADFQVQGRVNDVRGGRVELIDPSGQRIDRQPIAQDGRFSLTGASRASGLVEFRARVTGPRDEIVEDATLPVEVFVPTALRVLVLAGAPEAELKYLRRWALDSGVRLTTRIELGGGMQLGDAPIAFNSATLKGFDAVIVDERAWEGLGDARRRALLEAVRDGLGVLVRVGGPMPASVRNGLALLGLHVSNASLPSTFALPAQEDNEFTGARLGPGSAGAPTTSRVTGSEPPQLKRQPLRIAGANTHAWLRDNESRPLAAWREVGRGRVGIWLPLDTFQLVLLGRDDQHAQLWSDAIAEIARPVAGSALPTPGDGRQGTRMVLCGLKAGATVVPPGAPPKALLVDPVAAAASCAGFWPQTAGWHALHSGTANTWFYVRGARELPGIAAREDREATRRLALQPPSTASTVATVPGASWPWFLAWLLVSAALWWLERMRAGSATGHDSLAH